MASMGGVGGALGCDGAFLLQWSHEARVLVMAGVMPGQKTDASARSHIGGQHGVMQGSLCEDTVE